MDTQEFLKQWRALTAQARAGDKDAILLLVNAVASGAYWLNRWRDDPFYGPSEEGERTVLKDLRPMLRGIAQQRDSWPILFTGQLDSDKILCDLQLGKNLPFTHSTQARFKEDQLGEFVKELVLKVIETGRIYHYYQSAEYRKELQPDELPDYAQDASRLTHLDRDSFKEWWQCIDAELELNYQSSLELEADSVLYEFTTPLRRTRTYAKQRIKRRLLALAMRTKRFKS